MSRIVIGDRSGKEPGTAGLLDVTPVILLILELFQLSEHLPLAKDALYEAASIAAENDRLKREMRAARKAKDKTRPRSLIATVVIVAPFLSDAPLLIF